MVTPSEIDWHVIVSSDTRDLRDLHESQGAAWYAEQKQAIKDYLCGYFNAQPRCSGGHGTIAPVGSAGAGGKAIKMRWLYPGCGKSGGLRLLVVAYCDEQRVAVAGAWRRKEDPNDGDLERAACNAT